MVIHSELDPKQYLSAVAEQMGPWIAPGSERFTGFVLGRFFYVTYHSGQEFNRKITNEKNAACCYVKATDTGSSIHFRRFRGLLCPLQFLLFFVLTEAMCIISAVSQGINVLLMAAFGFVLLLVLAPVEALLESMTDQGEMGRRVLLSFLTDPSDPYANYRNIP